MGKRSRHATLLLVFVALASMVAVSTYAAPSYRWANVTGSGARPSGRPDTDGNIVVWRDGRNDRGDIYGRELFGGPERVITDAPGVQWQPRVSGNIVVWVDERTNYQYGGEDYQVFCYDLSTDKELSIPSHYATNPDVDGDRIVWEEVVEGGQQPSVVKLYDVGTSVGSQIATDAADPAVSGTRVVWLTSHRRQDDNALISNVFTRDLASGGEAAAIAATDAVQTDPDVSGNLVAWVQQRSGDDDLNAVYLADLRTGDSQRVFESPGPIESLSLGNRLLTWTAWNSAYTDGSQYEGATYVLDVASRELFALPGSAGDGGADESATGGDVVAWVDHEEPERRPIVRALTLGAVVDHTPPVTSLAGLQGSTLAADRHLTLKASDPGVFSSGVKTTRYALDDQATRTYTQPLSLELGEHVIEYFSVDASGNVEPAKTASFRVTEAESQTATDTPALPATGGESGWLLLAAAAFSIAGASLRVSARHGIGWLSWRR